MIARKFLMWVAGSGVVVLTMLLAQSAFAGGCSTATHIHLKTDCTGQSDCFEELGELDDWMWDQTDPANRCSAPSATDRVLIDVGPGTFTETGLNFLKVGLECPDGGATPNGYFTLRGSGKDQTYLVGESTFGAGTLMKFRRCTEVTVQDMSLINDIGLAIYWFTGGTSQWINLNVRAGTYGWYDGNLPCATPKGVHYWYSSKIEAKRKAYKASCDESWIFGTDVVLAATDTTNAGSFAVLAHLEGDVRLFGSTVRIDTSAVSAGTSLDLYGIRVGTSDNGVVDGEGTVHMHGGIVSLNATGVDDADLTAVEVNRGTGGTGPARAHVVDTAFAINDKATNTGSVKRVELLPATASDTGLQSPFLWPAATEPPLQDRLESASGYDQYVEKDCADDGDCNDPPNAHPHLMIYDESCDTPPGNSPWFNTTTGRCRNDTG